jgi:putative transposase
MSNGILGLDDRRIVTGIIFLIRNGLHWRDVLSASSPHKTTYNRPGTAISTGQYTSLP